MNLLIVDTETTGLDPSQDNVIEIAAILYSVEHRCILQQVSTLLSVEENPQEKLNKISAAATNSLQWGKSGDYPANVILELIYSWVDHADYAVAHNASFDRSFLEQRLNLQFPIPWLCTCHDFVFPEQTYQGQSLVSLALAYGVPVVSAHRALDDCQLIASIFDRVEDLEGLIQKAAQPKVLVVANVSYDDRQLAKDAGFSWDKLVPRQWSRKMAWEEAQALPFRVTAHEPELELTA